MKEPCQSYPRREIDFGGCRYQALLTGDAIAYCLMQVPRLKG